MVNYPNYLSGSQDDINKRLLHMILELKKDEGADISALETTVGDENSGLVKDVNALKTTVGNSDSGLVKDVAANKTAIGSESTEGSILYRIKALEDA